MSHLRLACRGNMWWCAGGAAAANAPSWGHRIEHQTQIGLWSRSAAVKDSMATKRATLIVIRSLNLMVFSGAVFELAGLSPNHMVFNDAVFEVACLCAKCAR